MKQHRTSFWQGLKIVGLVTALTVFTLGVFSEQCLALAAVRNNDQMLINNPSNGKAAFWVLNSNGSLKNRTKGYARASNDYGWDMVSDWYLANGWYVAAIRSNGDVRETGTASATATYPGNQLIWHNSTNGKFCYWTLNSNGNLKNRTKTDGWDLLSDWNLASPWRVAGVVGRLSDTYTATGSDPYWEDYLQLNNTTNGKTAFWVLNSNGTLRNRTKGNARADTGYGWDLNSDWYLASGWYVAAIRNNGDARETGTASVTPTYQGTQLVWHNSTNGKFCYWTLNSNGNLKNRTKTNGWDLLSDWNLASPWRVTGVIGRLSSTYSATGSDPYWEHYLQINNTTNGKTAFWVLNSNGSLRNRTKGDARANTAYGWNLTSDWYLASGWYMAAIRATGDGRETNNSFPGNQMVWHNSTNGKFCYWTLNSNGTLKNRTKTSGWDLLSDWTLAPWRVRGIQTNFEDLI